MTDDQEPKRITTGVSEIDDALSEGIPVARMVPPTPESWRKLFEDDAELERRASVLDPEGRPRPELATGIVSMYRWQSVTEAKLWLAERRELAILREVAKHADHVPFPWPGDAVRGGQDQEAWRDMAKALRKYDDFRRNQPGAKVTSWQHGWRHEVGDWVQTTIGDHRIYVVTELTGESFTPRYTVERPGSRGPIVMKNHSHQFLAKVFSHTPHCWVGEDREALEAWRRERFQNE